MLLRASGQKANLETNVTEAMSGNGDADCGVEHGSLLRTLALAITDRKSESVIAKARTEVLETLGPEALVDTAGVIATFNAINRIADATGTELDPIIEDGAKSLMPEVDLEELENRIGRV